MNDDGERYDSRFDGGGPFRVTPEAGGISLEAALRDYGPAAFDDLIPRIRSLANALVAAHAGGAVHGALHPGKIIIEDEATYLIAGERSTKPFDSAQGKPYVAPEVAGGEPPTPASDQFALAAITYEWMFGRKIDGPAERPVQVRSLPGVDRATLAKAFTRALAPEPAARFASCAAFCDALAAAAAPELPLLPISSDRDDFDRIGRLEPAQPADDLDDVPLAGEPRPAPETPDFQRLDRAVSDPVASWNPSATATPASEGQRFGGFALILAAIVGAIFGFAAGYMARPRALQSNMPQMAAPAPGTENEVASATKPVPPVETKQSGEPDTSESAALQAPAASASARPDAGELRRDKPVETGRLLVRSNPSGASVAVDGVPTGVTPLALRDLELGTRSITLSRRGYITETRRVVITTTRPSRSLDVRLTAQAAAAPARPGAPATLAKPAAGTGSLAVESRPVGASVTINGKPGGNTPLTLSDLAPGEYRIVMSMPGYRNLAMTVRVVAGERARAAASLTAQEQE